MHNKTIISLLFFALTLGTLTPGKVHALFGKWGSTYKAVTASNGEVQIPINKINDGKAHYFSFTEKGKTINFFIIKSRDNVIRAAFDACDVCYPKKKGYSQQGDFMICNNCGQKFHSTRINVVKGGCNPAPLNRKEQGKNLVIRVADIRTGSYLF